jgi:type II secretory pathway pseudopilin PulG
MSTFCMRCGSSIDDQDQFCRNCGAQASAPAAPASAMPTVPAGPAQTSGKAIASLIFGLLFFVPFAFVAAVILGHLGLSEIRKSAGRLKGDGLAIAGLVLGYMWVVSIPIILIIAAIAIPNLLRARMAANASSAVAAVRTINTAQIAYSGSHPETGYACSLSALGEGQMIDSALASGQKNGYRFEIKECEAETQGGPNTKYQVVAYPITANQTGDRTFCSDESAVIKQHSGGSVQNCLENGAVLQ